ncbi:MAG: aminoglycoside phosphotransferase family protein [Alphaproteobacteria bacterium]
MAQMQQLAQSNRDDERLAFIQSLTLPVNWQKARITPLAGDASFRRYFRLETVTQHAMLMDCPPGKEPLQPYLYIANLLQQEGFSAPTILQHDLVHGFALIEDFGDETFTRLLAKGHDERSLYDMAVDVLSAITQINWEEKSLQLPYYDTEKLIAEARLLPEWYYPAMTHGRICSTEAVREYEAAWRYILKQLNTEKNVLVLRDYHVDNLMLLKERSGAKACGLLDFQDAVLGHPAYDLVSLLEDARRKVNDELTEHLWLRYTKNWPQQRSEEFGRSCRILGTQRHCKVIGIFVRLSVRDGKNQYIKHIPHVLQLLARGIHEPALGPLFYWLDKYLPHWQEWSFS